MGSQADTVSFVICFVFLSIVPYVIARSLLSFVGTPVPLSPTFSFVAVGSRALGRPISSIFPGSELSVT